MSTPSSLAPAIIDRTTVLSLLATLALLIVAYVASLRLLSPSTSTKVRILFIWHAFDALIHLLLEGSFLYNCFFTYTSIPNSRDNLDPAILRAPGAFFLGQKERLYGSNHGSNPMARLWQEYAKADRRWGEADLTIVSIELLTVFIAGPLAVYVCQLIRRQDRSGKLWFWASLLATGELYGGKFFFWISDKRLEYRYPRYDTSAVKAANG